MAAVERFEDLESWKKARELTKRIYTMTRSEEVRRDYGLCDQLRRACVSIMSNIAEGFERGGNNEFRQFLSLAKGSAGEVRSQLYVALDAAYISQEQFDHLYALSCEISRLLSGLLNYLASSDWKGNKYK